MEIVDYTENLNLIYDKLCDIENSLNLLIQISDSFLGYFLFFFCLVLSAYLCYLIVKPLWLCVFKY